ncbi:MAG: hypothetical protein ACRELZ_09070 [Candidatus Rokuibacteriota bacterium]
MLAYHWPGNVSEVKAVMERVACSETNTVVTAAMLALVLRA